MKSFSCAQRPRALFELSFHDKSEAAVFANDIQLNCHWVNAKSVSAVSPRHLHILLPSSPLTQMRGRLHLTCSGPERSRMVRPHAAPRFADTIQSDPADITGLHGQARGARRNGETRMAIVG